VGCLPSHNRNNKEDNNIILSNIIQTNFNWLSIFCQGLFCMKNWFVSLVWHLVQILIDVWPLCTCYEKSICLCHRIIYYHLSLKENVIIILLYYYQCQRSISLILWLFFMFFTDERKICSITCDFFCSRFLIGSSKGHDPDFEPITFHLMTYFSVDMNTLFIMMSLEENKILKWHCFSFEVNNS
jgi:hypothetical protein